MRSPRRSVALALFLLVCLLASSGPGVAATSRAHAAPVDPVTDINPLAGRTWGVYQGKGDQTWLPYLHAVGATKRLLSKIALAPKAKWFGDWVSNGDIEDKIHKYVVNSQAGDPDALVQLSLFRMVPWEHDSCTRLPTAAERASYKDWMDKVAQGIGDAHAAVILQPDGPFALCAPHGSLMPSRLIGYASRILSALPNTSVYIDAGAADWPAGPTGVASAVRFLLPAGVRYARGIALDTTHYSATGDEVVRGAQIVKALAARGITDKHVVVNTSSNGHPFVFGDYDGKDAENARVCRSKLDKRLCVTLGVPPTTDVSNPAWGLSDGTAELAGEYVDGYMWIGRPWLYKQSDPFVLIRALGLIRSSPY